MQVQQQAIEQTADKVVTAESPYDAASVPAAAALHARMLCALVAVLASEAAPVLQQDDASLRAVLLPVLQGTVSTSTAVASQASATMEALAQCALSCLSAAPWRVPAFFFLASLHIAYMDSGGVLQQLTSHQHVDFP